MAKNQRKTEGKSGPETHDMVCRECKTHCEHTLIKVVGSNKCRYGGPTLTARVWHCSHCGTKQRYIHEEKA